MVLRVDGLVTQGALTAHSQGGWHPGIGDPTLLGWLAVVLYAVASILAIREGLRELRYPTVAEPAVRIKCAIFWGALGLLLALLAINKQLDVQSWVTEQGRELALKQGWYGYRDSMRRAFMVAVGLLCLGVLLLGVWLLGGRARRHKLLFVGLLLVFLFVVMRGSAFHHLVVLPGTEPDAARLNWLLELTGVSLIMVGTPGRRPDGPQ